ncbi:MAG: hypothetical protein PHS41_00925 [Victivallaceae bacterium]|nr:hypothetical protein [Victivallaceae bacterium]
MTNPSFRAPAGGRSRAGRVAASGHAPQKLRWAWIAAGIAMSCGLFFLLRARTQMQAPSLPPEEEAMQNFKRAIAEDSQMLGKLYHLQRSLAASRKIPQEQRRQMLIRAASSAVCSVMEDFSRLPEKDKDKRASVLQADADSMHRAFRALPPEKRKKALELLQNDPEAKANFDRAIRLSANRLSPADRGRLGPTIALWQKILEDKP